MREPDAATSGSGAGHADPRLAQDLARILRRRIGPKAPGAALAVYRDGSPVASAASGLASLEHAVPMSVTTPIEVASVSKQLSAAAILTMARDGLLDLDDDVRTHVPELRIAGITLRHCLQHTSGLPDYLTVGEILGVPVGLVIGYDAFLTELARTTELHYPTGTDVSYSNTGYVVAAIAAERAGGATFPQLVADRVFGPLGMTSSKVRSSVDEVTPGMAFSYEPHPQRDFVRVEMGEPHAIAGARHTVGDGEVMTTIDDFAAWHGFLLDGRVLGVDIRDQLLERSRLADGQVTNYGMGLGHSRVGGVDAFGHSGSMWGYRSQSLTDPHSRTGVAVFGNRSDLDPGDLAWRALRAAIEPVPVGGGWYSPEAVRELEVTLRGDGGVDVDGDGESMALDRAGDCEWMNRSEPGGMTLDADVLVLTDEMGRRTRYVRTVQDLPAPPPDSVVGTYQVAGRPDTSLVVRAADTGLELVRGGFPPSALEFVTTHDGVDVYRVEGAALTVDRSRAEPCITISAGSAVLRDIPRTG